jgi:hypothetical protein
VKHFRSKLITLYSILIGKDGTHQKGAAPELGGGIAGLVGAVGRASRRAPESRCSSAARALGRGGFQTPGSRHPHSEAVIFPYRLDQK